MAYQTIPAGGSASASQAGTMSIVDFNKLATVPTGATIAQVYTAAVDFMVVGFYAFNTPLVAGARFVRIGTLSEVIESQDAASTTGPTLGLAQNGIAIGTTGGATSAQINARTLPATFNVTVLNDSPLMTTNVLQLHVSVAASGGGITSMLGYVSVVGYYDFA